MLKFVFLLVGICASLSTGMVFDCRYGMVVQPKISPNQVYQCTVGNLFMGWNGYESLEYAQGTHLPGKANFNVESLSMNRVPIHKIPKGLNGAFPNLLGIQILESNLKSITPDDLPFRNLIALDVKSNSLYTLPPQLFKNTPNLQYAGFCNCSLEIIDDYIFSGLIDLREVDMRVNTCISKSAIGNKEIIQLTNEIVENCPINTDRPAGCIASKAELTSIVNGLRNILENLSRIASRVV
jgi:Leucine-rich repeat (LRR) protein